jgi:hypothetical protein
MPENHLRAIPCLKRHLRHVLNVRHPITDKRMPERVVLPGERLPTLILRGFEVRQFSSFALCQREKPAISGNAGI